MKFCDGIKTARKALSAAQTDMTKIQNSLEAAVIGYRKILGSPDMAGDRTAGKEADTCFAIGNDALDILRTVRDELQGFVGATLYQKFDW